MPATIGPKTILLTGGTGFVGRNILPILEEGNTVLAPPRAELDIKEPDAVASFVQDHGVDVIVHTANPNPAKNVECDSTATLFEDSMRAFMSVYLQRDNVESILYLGSGAEYDKGLEMHEIGESEAGRSFPADSYGAAKYIQNALASSTENVTNLRLFACFGPYDHESKFITHCIRCVLLCRDVTIRQDCRFDYLHVSDLGRIISRFASTAPEHRDYNVASGHRYLLSEIARIVMDEMGSDASPMLLKSGLNREYTADVSRLEDETGLLSTAMSLRDGIASQIEFETTHMDEWAPAGR